MVGHILPERALLDDLVQSLHEHMLLRRDGAPARIAACLHHGVAMFRLHTANALLRFGR